ncbi:MAG TPA: hypothetical protein VJ837_04475 [Candidatus Paceibacterota bacterium]|nr:hypothetical protein [Candidatus Paceibacterota bacterium]
MRFHKVLEALHVIAVALALTVTGMVGLYGCAVDGSVPTAETGEEFEAAWVCTQVQGPYGLAGRLLVRIDGQPEAVVPNTIFHPGQWVEVRYEGIWSYASPTVRPARGADCPPSSVEE